MNQTKWTREQTKKWDQRFANVCEAIADWSSCLSRQIGAVIVRDKTIVSTGFNGPPRGVVHCGPDRIEKDPYFITHHIDPKLRNICPRRALGYGSGEGLHICSASHAEENAIVNAARLGISTLGTSIYMNCGIPCKDCLKKIINAGIEEIICLDTHSWYDELSKFLVKESNLKVRAFYHLDERKET